MFDRILCYSNFVELIVFLDDDGVVHVFVTGKPCFVVAGGADNCPVLVAHIGDLLADGAFFQLLL
ncbi:hypothetical protein, partial [Candidatus Borrarchaeum sp.]|uniref:hypothetical protein n=1 Tax=Candidatus Borrarchaeum sp. TaxID=2846742 RepID=UPI00257FE4CE